MRALVFALAVAALACGGEGPVRVDPAFSADEAAAVIEAVDEWCLATDGGVCPGAIVAHRDGHAISLRPGALPGREAGRELGGQIMIDTEQLPDAYAVKLVAMHEIGHALGLPHAPDGLMREDVTNAPACIDARTLRAVCLAYDCGSQAEACQ